MKVELSLLLTIKAMHSKIKDFVVLLAQALHALSAPCPQWKTTS